MATKFKEIITSTRFIQLFIVSVIQSLVLFNVVTSVQGEGLINIISALLIGSVTIRTVDKNVGEARVESAKVTAKASVNRA